MTNQAAQTMPSWVQERELIRATLCKQLDTDIESDERTYTIAVRAANALHWRQVEIDRLKAQVAALSQTAGAPSLEQWERTSMETLAAALRERGDDLSTDSASWLEKWLAAAPAASGGEDQSGYFINGKPVSEDYHNGFLDGLCRSPGSTQGKRESAASVSERARALLAAEFDGIGMHGVANDVRMNKLAVIDKAIIRALEQALTQPSDAERERDLLAEAIGNAGIKCGLLRKDIEGLTGPQLLMVCDDMAQALTQQRGEVEDEDYHVIMSMGRLLAEIAVILKGAEPAGTAWSYHDLPELVKSAVENAHDIASEMRAWAAVKMRERGSSRRDKMMVEEWSKRLLALPEVAFPVKDFDIPGLSITKEEIRFAIRKVVADRVFIGQDFGGTTPQPSADAVREDDNG